MTQDPEARRIWRQEAPQQVQLGVLTQSARLAFRLLCEAAADYTTLRADVLANGRMEVNRFGQRQVRPELTLMLAARRELQAHLRTFGMTPVDLARVVGEAGEGPEDELAAFRRAHPE
jgi:phage terminase small subunit